MADKKTFEKFLSEAKAIHPTLDFSLVDEYSNNSTKIDVICHKTDYLGREHGIFNILPNNLLKGRGCPKCANKGFSSEDRKFFCLKKYNNKYDYSKSDFSTSKNKTTVICKEHGEFQVDFDHHFNSSIGCPYCSYPSRDTESFKKEAEKIHDGFYGYDKVNYINSHKKVTIVCPIHGDFEQSPNAHLRGQGCPKCGSGRIVLEEMVNKLLESNKIEFERNYKPIWLNKMSLDFFIPSLKLAIECQGKQHFGLGGWSENFDFNAQFERDRLKKELCIKNDVNLIYFANKNEAPKQYIGKIFTDLNELMDYIRYLYKSKNN